MSRLGNIRKVLLFTLLLNSCVAVAKIIYGYAIYSISMISDGFHSLFDGASNVIGLIGIWIASRPPDADHPYGHRKFENLSTIAIAVLIFAAGIEILREAYLRLHTIHEIEVTVMSFIVMGLTVTTNVWVMTYESRKGRDLKSDFLLADAMHTRSDIYISLSVVISLIAAKAGYPVVDLIAAFIIVLFIAKMGFTILKSATNVLTDAICIHPDEIRKLVLQIQGVKDCHRIRTRGNENFVNVDLHLHVDPEASTVDAHKVAHTVEDAIKKEFRSVVDVVIHVEPFEGEKSR